MLKFKNDKYKKARGGYSRLLKITCEKCNTDLCLYQKDGPGILKRMYLDRIYESDKYSGLQDILLKDTPIFKCSNCKQILGTPIVYRKENRLAYRLYIGAVKKAIVRSGQ